MEFMQGFLSRKTTEYFIFVLFSINIYFINQQTITTNARLLYVRSVKHVKE